MKMQNALESATILSFNSGEITLSIDYSNSQVDWARSDLALDLSLPYLSDAWYQVGGYYKEDGVLYFSNDESLT